MVEFEIFSTAYFIQGSFVAFFVKNGILMVFFLIETKNMYFIKSCVGKNLQTLLKRTILRSYVFYVFHIFWLKN